MSYNIDLQSENLSLSTNLLVPSIFIVGNGIHKWGYLYKVSIYTEKIDSICSYIPPGFINGSHQDHSKKITKNYPMFSILHLFFYRFHIIFALKFLFEYS